MSGRLCVQLETNLREVWTFILQVQRGPSPGWKCLQALSHLRHWLWNFNLRSFPALMKVLAFTRKPWYSLTVDNWEIIEIQSTLHMATAPPDILAAVLTTLMRWDVWFVTLHLELRGLIISSHKSFTTDNCKNLYLTKKSNKCRHFWNVAKYSQKQVRFNLESYRYLSLSEVLLFTSMFSKVGLSTESRP